MNDGTVKISQEVYNRLRDLIIAYAEEENAAKAQETYTIKQIMDTAASLFEPNEPNPNREYARGVCELIGRLRLDHGGHGEESYFNALEVGDELHVLPIYGA